MTEDKTELLPCPFCGGEAEQLEAWVKCGNDDCTFYQYMTSAKYWNTRATVTPSDKAAALEEFIDDARSCNECGGDDFNLSVETYNTIIAALQTDDSDLVKALESQIEATKQTSNNKNNCQEVIDTAVWITKANEKTLAKHKAKVQG